MLTSTYSVVDISFSLFTFWGHVIKDKITLPSNIVCQRLHLFLMLKPFSIIDLEK